MTLSAIHWVQRGRAGMKRAVDRSLQATFYNLYTLWLFTYSDLKTTVCPAVAFALFSCLSDPVLTTNVSSPKTATILAQVPQVLLWTWIHTLFVDLQNQIQPGAAEEDKINKPWRPLPAGRLSEPQMQNLLSVMYIVIPFTGFFMDTSRHSLGLIVLGFTYNDLGGADKNFIVRNVVNAMGISCFTCGATSVALAGSGGSPTTLAYQWFLLIAVVISTTVQVQDMADQPGDKMRRRHTLPLIFGDGPARWMIAIPIVFWSFLCPFFFHLGALGFMMPLLLGGIIVRRTLMMRSVEADKETYRLYNLWMMVLFLLPFLKSLGDI